ncbi:hypothetical protein CCAE64S_01279 [Castellaniella caeni]
MRLGGRTVLVPVLEPRRNWHAGAGQNTAQPLFRTSNISIVARHAVEPSRHLGPQGAGFQDRDHTVPPSSPLCPRRNSKQGKKQRWQHHQSPKPRQGGTIAPGWKDCVVPVLEPRRNWHAVRARTPCGHRKQIPAVPAITQKPESKATQKTCSTWNIKMRISVWTTLGKPRTTFSCRSQEKRHSCECLFCIKRYALQRADFSSLGTPWGRP